MCVFSKQGLPLGTQDNKADISLKILTEVVRRGKIRE